MLLMLMLMKLEQVLFCWFRPSDGYVNAWMDHSQTAKPFTRSSQCLLCGEFSNVLLVEVLTKGLGFPWKGLS